METTAKTLEAAREAALDRLGVGADEAEFDVVEEPKPGLFGRTRGQARIRARVRPTPVRPKQERRRRTKGDKSRSRDKAPAAKASGEKTPGDETSGNGADDGDAAEHAAPATAKRSGTSNNSSRGGRRGTSNNKQQESTMNDQERPESPVSPQEVGDAAVSFMNDLVTAFGSAGTAELTVDGTELDVQVRGEDLGLLVGPGGRTLNAVQDLVRVAAQRRLGDHETRLRIDVAGYRERRSAALAKFAADVAQQVRDSGTARSLEPMTSADRKVIHDALNEQDGVESTSSGEDPYRRVIVQPT
ncbi:MAG: KH domain-containing protein [Phycisphaerales bacterium]|nr:KH domain-containing protein [Phycisphaerales bacterium]